MTIRAPRPSEWRACRMLLPASFGPAAPEAFVAWDENARAIVGMAAFHHLGRETKGTSVTTVPPYRRQGIGSRLLSRVVERARERGDERVCADVDLLANPEAEVFFRANGFLGRVLLEMEGDLGAVREPLLDMHARLVARGRIPSSARIADSAEFGPDELERLYTDLLVPHLGLRREPVRHIVTRPDFTAVVVMVGDKPVGMLVYVANDGKGMGTLCGMAVQPGFRGRGWANLLLLLSSMERGWKAGARRISLAMEETNLKSVHQSERLNAVVVRRRASFVCELAVSAIADRADVKARPD